MYIYLSIVNRVFRPLNKNICEVDILEHPIFCDGCSHQVNKSSVATASL